MGEQTGNKRGTFANSEAWTPRPPRMDNRSVWALKCLLGLSSTKWPKNSNNWMMMQICHTLIIYIYITSWIYYTINL